MEHLLASLRVPPSPRMVGKHLPRERPKLKMAGYSACDIILWAMQRSCSVTVVKFYVPGAPCKKSVQLWKACKQNPQSMHFPFLLSLLFLDHGLKHAASGPGRSSLRNLLNEPEPQTLQMNSNRWRNPVLSAANRYLPINQSPWDHFDDVAESSRSPPNPSVDCRLIGLDMLTD